MNVVQLGRLGHAECAGTESRSEESANERGASRAVETGLARSNEVFLGLPRVFRPSVSAYIRPGSASGKLINGTHLVRAAHHRRSPPPFHRKRIDSICSHRSSGNTPLEQRHRGLERFPLCATCPSLLPAGIRRGEVRGPASVSVAQWYSSHRTCARRGWYGDGHDACVFLRSTQRDVDNDGPVHGTGTR